MKAEDCIVNKRVGMFNYGAAHKGNVLIAPKQVGDKLIAVIEWDSGTLQKVDISKLLSEDEIIAEETRIKAERKKLEEEFALVQAKVKEKADAAAALILEAQALAETVHREVKGMSGADDLLQEALDASGWYQSSYTC